MILSASKKAVAAKVHDAAQYPIVFTGVNFTCLDQSNDEGATSSRSLGLFCIKALGWVDAMLDLIEWTLSLRISILENFFAFNSSLLQSVKLFILSFCLPSILS